MSGTTSYTYDGLGRLKTAVLADGTIQDYTFDGNGNRKTLTVTNGEGTSITTYAYDLNDRLISETKDGEMTTYIYDSNGNMLSKSGAENIWQEYDYLNRMTRYSDKNGTTEYTYLPDNMRKSKKTDNVLTEHVWLGSEIALDIINNDVISYIQGIKSDYGWYVYNAHGDVVQLCDDNGNITRYYDYDPYGNALHEENETDVNPYRYCGEYLDLESDYVYLRARYYDPSIGRFISEDPAFDGYNWYVYCGGNPIMRWDPSGCDWFDDRWDDWQVGIGVLHDSGKFGSIFASYCEGTVYTLGDQLQAIAHPIDTFNKFLDDPLKNNPITGILNFYANIASASYDHNWNAVAYSMGGATSTVAVMGVSAELVSGLTKAALPNGINANFGGRAIMQGNALSYAPAISFSVSASQVATTSYALSASYVAFSISRPGRGMDNYRVLNNTKIKGYTVSMDLERGGSGANNIHLKVNQTKYYYNGETFVDVNGNSIPNSLKGNTVIESALQKALNRAESGW